MAATVSLSLYCPITIVDTTASSAAMFVASTSSLNRFRTVINRATLSAAVGDAESTFVGILCAKGLSTFAKLFGSESFVARVQDMFQLPIGRTRQDSRILKDKSQS